MYLSHGSLFLRRFMGFKAGVTQTTHSCSLYGIVGARTEMSSNSSHFVTVLCKTFQEPKKPNNPEKTFPSPLSDGKNENL
ncbi:hypothetical protein Q9233_002583 [Columba guinea]|nr:hypothetical protein Q9233_002583 [Columba guinea]